MNIIVLKGRLTHDPELKKAGKDQKSVCNFTIAINRRFQKDTTDFIICEAWGQTAEFIAKYFSKGKEIAVVGELHIDKYEKDGENRYSTTVNVNNVEFCGSKNEGENAPKKAANTKADASDFEEIDDDDLPFC